MFWDRYSEQGRAHRPRSVAVAGSIAAHGALVFLLLHADFTAPEFPKTSKSEYEQAIAGKEKQIVWYRFKKDLPDVSPKTPKVQKKQPLKAEFKAKQSIVASPKDAPKRRQIVVSPAPELSTVPPMESANVLAVKMPDIAPPPPLKTPVPEIGSLPDAPAIAPVPTETLKAEMPKVKRPFQQPANVKPPTPTKTVQPLADAPEITASFDALLPEVFNVPTAAPRRPFQPPRANPPATSARAIRMVTPPPTSTGTGTIPSRTSFSYNPMARGVMPPVPDAVQGNNRDLSLAVVGLNPIDSAKLPTLSNPAEFSTGPVIRKDGATSTGDSKGVTVSDIFVRGAKDAKPDLIARAYAPVTSPENIREAMRRENPSLTRGAASTAAPAKMQGAIQVSSGPDPRFQGRDVFMMAIQMPNLTSYSGSWLMWYAERTAREKGLGNVAPPVAYRKVDPKYIATAVEDRIQGRVQLACVIKSDGTVAGVEIVRGVDDRLNKSAEEALAKWEFAPAMRNGRAIDVDVIVEIPFQLAPKERKP